MENIEKHQLRWIQLIQWEAFSLYWLSNLILWFPWSVSPWLGMSLMLTVGAALWGYGSYYALVRFPGESVIKAALSIAIIFLAMSVFMDYIFFVLIRNAGDQLYHPTTYYGYAFVALVPFVEALIIRKRFNKIRKVFNTGFLKVALPGVISVIILTLIILLDIQV